jgi:hypothetical protein
MNGEKFLTEWCAASYCSPQRENLLKRVTKLDLAYLAQGEHQEVLRVQKMADTGSALAEKARRKHSAELAKMRVTHSRQQHRILETLLSISESKTEDADAIRDQLTLLIHRIVEAGKHE